MNELRKLFNDLVKMNHTYNAVTITRNTDGFKVHIGSENVGPIGKSADLELALKEAAVKTQAMVDAHREKLLVEKKELLRRLALVESNLDITKPLMSDTPVVLTFEDESVRK